jgi:hypothetical protein
MNRLLSTETRNPRLALPLLLLLSAMAIALPRFSSITPDENVALSAGAAANIDAASSPIATAAMRVHVDPETGELVPAVGNEAARLRAGMARSHSVKGLQVVTRPDGGRSVHLEGRFMESYVATIDPAGGTRLDCLPEDQAERFVHENARPAPAGAVER